MAFMAGNIKSLLSIKLKARHDSYTDQFSRIVVAKIFIVASLIMGVDWFKDTVNCVLPKASDLKDDYINSACWIKGFYIYPQLGSIMRKSSHYGIPLHLSDDGIYNGTEHLCSTKERFEGARRPSCIPLRKHYFAQYQWMPFFIASLSLFYYLPYIMFRAANADLISLRGNVKGQHDLPAHDIIQNYFDHNINSKSKMRWRVFFNLVIKFVYVFVNIFTFYVLNIFLNTHFKSYGKNWTDWANENTSYAMDFDTRHAPTPGNLMLPTFGMCDIHESNFDSTVDYGNRLKFVCEISSNILYQYVFLVLWFVLVISIGVSIVGVFLCVYNLMVSAAVFVKNDKCAKFMYKFLTFRECEYLEYIRRKNLRLYGDVIRLIRDMKFHHVKTAIKSMREGIRDMGLELNDGKGIDLEGFHSDGLHIEEDETFDDTVDSTTPFVNYRPRPVPRPLHPTIYREPVCTGKSLTDKLYRIRNRLSSNETKETSGKEMKIPVVRRPGASGIGKRKNDFSGGGKRR